MDPPPPWKLTGRAIVAPVPAPAGEPPAPLRSLPGPGVLIAARYDQSPVGPYLELAHTRPARAAAVPGMTVTTMVVTSPASLDGGRAHWGFPKELGTLEWAERGDDVELVWQDRELRVTAHPRGPAMPLWTPLLCVQVVDDAGVVVPGRVWGAARMARVDVSTSDTDLAALTGRSFGAVVTGLRLVVSPARSLGVSHSAT